MAVCDKFLTFNNDVIMPAFGIGTWMAPDEEIESALNTALEAGYRHIDTAPIYMNEKAIGRVLKEWLDSGRLKREELFITTKLPPPANIPDYVEPTLRNSLDDLQLDYVDLYLIHVPFGVQVENGDFKRDENGLVVVEPNTDHLAVWKKMELIYDLGLAKAIGVSNFTARQIQRILKNCKVRPANLQIEHHVYLQQPDLVNFCKREAITVTAYSPLGSKGIAGLNKMVGIERELPDLMEIPEVKEIAEAHGKTPAQVLLRWIIDCGLSAIPKSTNPERIKENLDIFDFQLNEEEIEKLKGLDANIRVCDFKFFPGVERHPEFPF
ncbi:1,5-anhydro-D-fructose reductase [Stomoxys calcitrans]|uniref:NADP-dependent oxidoreductase domain-containing protein n=1 Tax=Stomoxys calcitrans TaxID=35570 RepID=A0A1I8P5U1_STOCA|nr:1,5-anhydro-D-fructose reductase [Stomoxys calcitrans]